MNPFRTQRLGWSMCICCLLVLLGLAPALLLPLRALTLVREWEPRSLPFTVLPGTIICMQ